MKKQKKKNEKKKELLSVLKVGYKPTKLLISQ